MKDKQGQIKAKSIKSNYIYNVLYEVFALLAPLITTPYVSRILGADGVGIYSFTYSLAQYFVILGNLGIATYGQMAIAETRDDRQAVSIVFWELFILRLTATLISLLFYILFVFSLDSYRIARLILCATVLSSALDLSWFFRGIEDFSKVVLRNFLVKITMIILVFMFVKTKDDVNKYIALIAFSTLIGNMTFFIPLKKLLVKVHLRNLQLKKHVKSCMVYFLPTIATSVYTVLDKSMIGWLTTGTSQNGFYEQAHKIEQILITVIISLNTIMRSRMTYLYRQKKIEEMKARLDKSISFIQFLAIPMAAGLAGISPKFIPFFLGEGYDESILLLQIFSLLFIVIGLSNCLNTHFLGPAGRQGKNNYVLIAGAVVNATMNYLTIPHYGAVGAACASVIAEGLILGGYMFLSRDFIKPLHIIRLGWKYVVSGVTMMLIVMMIGRSIVCTPVFLLVIQVLVGAITYIGLLFLMRDLFFVENIKMLFEKTTNFLPLHRTDKRIH